MEKVWIVCGKLRKLCTTFAANPQVSALPPYTPRHMMLRALKEADMTPAVRCGVTRRRQGACPMNPEGGSRYQPQSGTRLGPRPGKRLRAQTGRKLDRPSVPGFDLCPGCGHGRTVLNRRIGDFQSVEPGRLQERCQVRRLSARDAGVPGPVSLTPLFYGFPA